VHGAARRAVGDQRRGAYRISDTGCTCVHRSRTAIITG
jgi:hypothetical protein